MSAVEHLNLQRLDTENLHTYWKNPRIGNVEKIAESLHRNGQYRAIVVNKGTHTGRPMEVLAGNHTLKAARTLGWETITCHLIDVDDDQAARIVLADNKTAEYGSYDDKTLTDLLNTLNDLDGTEAGHKKSLRRSLTFPPTTTGHNSQKRSRATSQNISREHSPSPRSRPTSLTPQSTRPNRPSRAKKGTKTPTHSSTHSPADSNERRKRPHHSTH